MEKIQIQHNIGDIIENRFSEDRYMILGYEYVENRLRYVVINGEGKREYLLECEIKQNDDSKIGFISFTK